MTQEAKFAAGDKIRVLSAFKHTYWYSQRIGEEFTIKNAERMDDGWNYRVLENDTGLILESDAVLVTAVAETTREFVAKFAEGTKARIAKCRDQFFWYRGEVGQEIILGKAHLDRWGDIKYHVDTGHGYNGFIFEEDLEAIEQVTLDLTIGQVKAKLDELDATIQSCEAELLGVKQVRAEFVAELNALGLLVNECVQVAIEAPAPKRTLKDLYDEGTRGDIDIDVEYTGPDDAHNLTKGRIYKAVRIDRDGSIKVGTDDDPTAQEDWYWAWMRNDILLQEHFTIV